MLSTASSFLRNETHKATAHLIQGLEWFTTNKDGMGAIMTTGPGSSPTPPDYVLMALGACAGNGLKFLFDKAGTKYTNIDIEVQGTWTDKPQRRIGEITLAVTTDADIDEGKLNELVAQVEAKMCPVAGTLHTPPHVTTKACVRK